MRCTDRRGGDRRSHAGLLAAAPRARADAGRRGARAAPRRLRRRLLGRGLRRGGADGHRPRAQAPRLPLRARCAPVGRDGRRIASFAPSAFVGVGRPVRDHRPLRPGRQPSTARWTGASRPSSATRSRRSTTTATGVRVHVPQRDPAGVRPRGRRRRPALAGAPLAFGPQQQFERLPRDRRGRLRRRRAITRATSSSP